MRPGRAGGHCREFGLAPGTLTTGKLAAALRRLGVAAVYDTTFAAAVTIMEESAVLLAHPWPGNVRELRNAMEWVSVMHDAPRLAPEHLAGFLAGRMAVPGEPTSSGASLPPAPRRGRPTEAEIDSALTAASGNKTRAASLLGISIRMLHYRLAARHQAGPRKTGRE